MNELQEAYLNLQKAGYTYKLIITRLTNKGITPPRTSSYSKTQLSRMIREGYALNQAAANEIIQMSAELFKF
jgi:hypothetical protein